MWDSCLYFHCKNPSSSDQILYKCSVSQLGKCCYSSLKGVHGRRIAEVGSKEAIAGVEILKGETDKEKGHLSPRVTTAELRVL